MLTLAATDQSWVHSLDPVAIQFGPLAIRWYGLSYLAGFVAAWLLLKQMARAKLIAIRSENVSDFLLLLILGTFIGGRLGYVVFYKPSLFLQFTSDLPYWGVLAVNQGGMASHGGMIGLVLASLIFARRHKLPSRHLLDAVALVGPVGIFFGRLANFINGELLGGIVARAGSPAPWWAVRYPQEIFERPGESIQAMSPEQQAALNALSTSQLDPAEAQNILAGGGIPWEVGYMRILERVREGDAEAAQSLALFLNARHPSQLYQAFAEGIVVFAVVWWIARQPRISGVVTAWFLIVYGIGRVITEFYRLPDAHFEQTARILGFSRGQWLSAAMVLIGIACLVAVVKIRKMKAGPRTGGWFTRPQTTESG